MVIQTLLMPLSMIMEPIPHHQDPLREIGFRARLAFGGSLSWYRDQKGKIVLSASPKHLPSLAAQVEQFLPARATSKKQKPLLAHIPTMGPRAAWQRIAGIQPSAQGNASSEQVWNDSAYGVNATHWGGKGW